MNKVLETINKERVIKKHRRELIQKPISDLEKMLGTDNEKCAACKKELSSVSAIIIYSNSEGREFPVCSSDCIGKVIEVATKEMWKNKENEDNQIKDFSRTYLFAGNEFNRELEQLVQKELKSQVSFIDFSIHNSENPEFIERKIKEIYNNSQNQKLIKEGKFPIICLKNIDKIESNQNLEEALLPVFDKQQNAEIFHGEINLSNFVILATTSTPEVGKLSDPLISRLDVVNVDTVQTKQFFLDKYYYWILVPSILINLVLITLILWPKFTKKTNKNAKS